MMLEPNIVPRLDVAGDEIKPIGKSEPKCGKCSKVMTPENSALKPELFLCDECAVASGIAKPNPLQTPEFVQTIMEQANLYNEMYLKGMQAGYDRGYCDGLKAYAHWHNGQQEVGSCGTTLEWAIKARKTAFNYRP